MIESNKILPLFLVKHSPSFVMKLRVISKQIIKPYSPTPHHLKTHKLSLLDQLSPDIYFPFVFFYSHADKDVSKISHLLKTSLSRTLTHYYPFAGQVKDYFSVDCNDHGVPLVEAHVASNMSEVLNNPELDILEELMPFNPNKRLSTRVNQAVQLNYFDCGGIAISACFSHLIADGSAASYFFKNWSAVALDSTTDIKDVILDSTSIFPPHKLVPSISKRVNEKHRSTECITKRYTFDGNKIAVLREKIGNGSRFEAVSALIWKVLINLARERNEPIPIATIPVNIRNRMNPPLPQHCIGNMYHAVKTNWSDEKGKLADVDYSSLARNIRQHTKMVNDEFVRKIFENDVFANHYIKAGEEFLQSSCQATVFGFTGPLGFPYYEVDFGWGKPTWVTIPMRLNNIAVIMDSSSDSKGVEAWVGLPKKDMIKFDEDYSVLI